MGHFVGDEELQILPPLAIDIESNEGKPRILHAEVPERSGDHGHVAERVGAKALAIDSQRGRCVLQCHQAGGPILWQEVRRHPRAAGIGPGGLEVGIEDEHEFPPRPADDVDVSPTFAFAAVGGADHCAGGSHHHARRHRRRHPVQPHLDEGHVAVSSRGDVQIPWGDARPVIAHGEDRIEQRQAEEAPALATEDVPFLSLRHLEIETELHRRRAIGKQRLGQQDMDSGVLGRVAERGSLAVHRHALNAHATAVLRQVWIEAEIQLVQLVLTTMGHQHSLPSRQLPFSGGVNAHADIIAGHGAQHLQLALSLVLHSRPVRSHFVWLPCPRPRTARR